METAHTDEVTVSLEERRRKLYGPHRLLEGQQTKQKQQEDHILQNFRRGSECPGPSLFSQSETAQSFRV